VSHGRFRQLRAGARPWARLLGGVACIAGLACVPATAQAAVQRFALLVGNNQGQAGDADLRYAASDAAKLGQVLRDLGDFEPADIVVLRDEDADTARSTLISLNDRIRAAESLPGVQTLLFVYYSGHADGQALRLGSSRLLFRELAQLVRGSAAQFRLLVVDACRSGVLTRVKGGRIVAPFDVADSELKGEGMAFLTASSENEDAQESDELKGSFFSHALISGLLGAADSNGDGMVVLEEAYRHAYESTLRATSRTFAGTQHPTFQYELKGQGELVLTRPGRKSGKRAELVFPTGVDYLVLARDAAGPVMGEVGAQNVARSLSVPPGRYFVRGRGVDHLQEGTVTVVAGERRDIDPAELDRVEYARLVRKHGGIRSVASSAGLGVSARANLTGELRQCWGPVLGYRADLEHYGVDARFGYCASRFENASLVGRTDELELGLGVSHAWDFSWSSLDAGGGLGARFVYQSFETKGEAPPRRTASPLGFVAVGLVRSVTGPVYVRLDSRLEAHLYQYQQSALSDPELVAALGIRAALLTGLSW
jgi:hypothetical protein